MLDENQTLHYHARFEARSTDPTGTALDKVVGSVFDWLLGKEGRRGGPLAHLLRQAGRRGLAHGLAFPEGYLGKQVEKGGSRLCSQFLDDGGCSAWALEYDADARAARSNAQRLQDQAVALSNRASSLEYRLGAANARADSLARENATLRHAAQSLEGLEHLPNDLDSVLCLAEQLWPDRIVVLDEAHRSARAFAGTNLDEQWQVVSSVATKLWPLYFEGDCDDVAAAYEQASGYDLALTEGKLTKADASMMRLRQRTYHGETIDVTPHIKGRDSSAAMALRLHYHVDRKRHLIVIGHCGAHLTTYGTQRLS